MRVLARFAIALYFAALSANARAQEEVAQPAPILTETATDALTLSQLVDEAMRNNRKVAIDVAQVEEARALYEFAAAQAYPQIQANVLFGGPTSEQKTTVLNDPTTVTPESLEGDFDFGDLGVTFRVNAEGALPLYTFGKISNAKEAAKNVIRAANQKVGITQAEVVMNVHRAFWAYQLTRGFVVSLNDGEKTLIKVLNKIEELLEAESSQVTENDRLRMLYALATLRVKRSEAQRANDLTRDAMKLLVNRDMNARLSIAEADLDVLPPTIPELQDSIASAQLSRPELRALRALVQAHQKFADFRRAQLYPDFFIGGVLRYAYTSNATDQTSPFVVDDANYFDAALGFGLRWELDVFTKIAVLHQAEAQANTRQSEESAVSQAIDLEVRKLHGDLVNGNERISMLERANRAARGWLTAATLGYDIGTGDAGELIESFLAWAQSEGELQKVRYDMQITHADLARAAGKLIGERPQE
jgi:outer membrane protein TolC